VAKEVNTKMIFLVYGWISGEVCEISDVEIHNARIERLRKDRYAKWNDQLLSLGPEKSSPELIHPKINLVYEVFALK
jgi:hypothetical protein